MTTVELCIIIFITFIFGALSGFMFSALIFIASKDDELNQRNEE
jgi:hypothetical protein